MRTEVPSEQPFRGAFKCCRSIEGVDGPQRDAVKLDALPAANDRRDPAKQFIFGNRRIVPAKSVAVRDQRIGPPSSVLSTTRCAQNRSLRKKSTMSPLTGTAGDLRVND